jgi:glycosyltransferase involved in cell wall biosynthesis
MVQNSLPLVTIAIPTYNRAEYLAHALESAVKQTYQNIEIIVSDNCSTDCTENVVRGFNDPRIKYFKQKKNVGPDPNWNFCLQHATGMFFLLLQDDDLIDDHFVDVCMKAANYSTDIGIIRTGTREIDSDGNVLQERKNIARNLSTEEFIMAFLSCKLTMYLCGSIFNTKNLKEICDSYAIWAGTQYRHWEDVYAEIQLATRFPRIDVEDVMASFRKHPSQLTFQVNIREWIEDSILFLNSICDLAPQMKNTIRKKGLEYFFEHNCFIASQIKPSVKGLIAYSVIYHNFKSPRGISFREIYSFLYFLLSKTSLYAPLNNIKVNVKGVVAGLKKRN